jgi:mannan endo-1,4-beta-mannosidase
MDLARSLWDENYLEPSWLTSANLDNEPHNILNRVQGAIDTYFPGVGIMIGEWDFGHDMDISHGISTVDALGVFAQSRVQIANRWNTSSGNPGNYTVPAYKLLRNYDGALSTYGDICIPTTFSKKNKASVWASKNSTDQKLHLILLNKDLSKTNNYEIKLGEENYSVESVWGFDENSSLNEITVSTSNVSADSLYFSVPSLSAYHVVLSADNVTGNHSTFSPKIQLIEVNNYQYKLSEEANWKLFDLGGRLIIKGLGGIIDLKTLKTGLYIIKSDNMSWKITK